jgi:uncharacterized protein (TIGR00730 family)
MSPEKGKLRPTPPRAYLNPEFMLSPQARTIRVMAEMMEPYQRFKKYGVRNTVVMFGSARTMPPERARQELEAAKLLTHQGVCTDSECKARVRVAEMNLRSSAYYEACRALAYEMTKWSMTLPEWQRFLICSGGGPGIMEAANRGAHEAGGRSVGLGIALPFEQEHNPYIPKELDLEFHYFFVRKYWFLYLAKSLVAFPGGFGTFDELFEMLTLIQTGKTKKHFPVLLYGSPFWKNVLNLEVFHEWGMVSPEDRNLYIHVDSVTEARDHLINIITEKYLKPDDEGHD